MSSWAVIDWPLCIDTSIMLVLTIKRYIERTKEDMGTYSVIVKQNFYYLPINANTVSTDYLTIFMIH